MFKSGNWLECNLFKKKKTLNKYICERFVLHCFLKKTYKGRCYSYKSDSLAKFYNLSLPTASQSLTIIPKNKNYGTELGSKLIISL